MGRRAGAGHPLGVRPATRSLRWEASSAAQACRTSPKKSWGFSPGSRAPRFLVPDDIVPGVTMSIPQAILFGLASGLMGVLGDLAESRIKRNSGFKDSGTIMPGHGGLLDRCDSLFLVAVTSAILLVAGGCIPY
ncbi:MAG: phosphatidate cytidylyltransferase [Gordonibacter urolithinfaciens]